MLRAVKLAEWTSQAGRGASKFGLLTVTSPDEVVVWYIKRLYMNLGSSSGIYYARLNRRLGTATEVQRFQLMNDLEESGAFGFVRVASIEGRRTSYFTVGSSGVVSSLGCSYSGASLRLEDGHVMCLCDGYDNCNGTSNSRYTVYDPVNDLIIHGGDCTGFYVWLLAGDHRNIVGRLSYKGYERPFLSHLAIIPTDGDELVVVAGNSPPGRGLSAATVNVDDLAENGPSSATLNELPSFKELFSLPDASASCITCAKSLGDAIAVSLDRGDGVTTTAILNTKGEVMGELPGVVAPVPMGGAESIVEGRLKVYALQGTRELQDLQLGGRGSLVSTAGNLAASLNTVSGLVSLYALASEGPPFVPAVDTDTGEVGPVDLLTGDEADEVPAYVLWTRLAYSYYQDECTQTLPLLLSSRPERVSLRWGWTPRPPSEGRATLSVLPALL